MTYDYLISLMTWSYSRLCAFEDCKYRFFLRYINEEEETPKFFAEYGKLIHSAAERFLSGEITREEAVMEYLAGFALIEPRAPNANIQSNYFSQGLNYLKSASPCDGNIVTEKELRFEIGDYPFVGYADIVLWNKEKNNYKIQDIKTRILTPKNAVIFNKYMRQLYLYSVGLHKEYNQYPTELQFNCFRDGTLPSKEFDVSQIEPIKNWAVETIHKIENETDWSPTVNWFYCKYICGLSHVCEYYSLL